MPVTITLGICQVSVFLIAVLVVNFVVSCQLDYCNSLIYGVSKGSVAKLQKVPNALCHIYFQIEQNESCHTLFRKTPLAAYFIMYPIQIHPPHF